MQWELTISEYNLVSKIGQGAFAKVYKAHLLSDPDTLAAIKIESHDKYKNKQVVVNSFKNEIKLHSLLDHPNIVKYIESGIDATMTKHST